MVEYLVRAIVEIAGSPKDFVENTMKLLMEHLEKDGQIKVRSKEVFPTEEHDKMFSTFTELELEFKEFLDLVHFCFQYMPSNLEIISPPRLELRREELADLLNDLLLNLHKMDMIVKDVKALHQLGEEANKVLIKNSIAMALKHGPLEIGEISKATGIKEQNLNSILEFYEEKKLIKKQGKKYSMA